MKPLIIVDYSHTSMRMVFTAIAQMKPKKKDGKFITSDYIQYYKYLLFNSLQAVKNKIKGEVILAIDSKNNWRKDFYSEYKLNRVKSKDDSDINFDEFFVENDKVIETIKSTFPFKVLKVEKAEADDIAGTIALKYGNNRPITMVTSDHDWSQVLSWSETKMWDPMKKVFVSLTDYEKEIIETDFGNMSRFTIIHSLIGDKGDNVPGITNNTKFTDDFILHLKKNGISTTDVKEFNSLDSKDDIIESFNVFKITKSGHKKGQVTDIKDIYKTVPFGIKKAEKASENSDTLNTLLNSHNMYRDAFERNKTLVDFSMIPNNIIEKILLEFNNVDVNYDPDKMLEYFMNEGLGQHVSGINKFYDASYEVQKSSSLDDFF